MYLDSREDVSRDELEAMLRTTDFWEFPLFRERKQTIAVGASFMDRVEASLSDADKAEAARILEVLIEHKEFRGKWRKELKTMHERAFFRDAVIPFWNRDRSIVLFMFKTKGGFFLVHTEDVRVLAVNLERPNPKVLGASWYPSDRKLAVADELSVHIFDLMDLSEIPDVDEADLRWNKYEQVRQNYEAVCIQKYPAAKTVERIEAIDDATVEVFMSKTNVDDVGTPSSSSSSSNRDCDVYVIRASDRASLIKWITTKLSKGNESTMIGREMREAIHEEELAKRERSAATKTTSEAAAGGGGCDGSS